jgi:cyanate permease
VAVLVGRHELTPPRLDAIVMPIIADDRVAAVEPLGRAAATRGLLACARVVSLRTREHAKTMFRLAATLGADIPVYRVSMPSLIRAALPQGVGTLLAEHLGPPQ